MKAVAERRANQGTTGHARRILSALSISQRAMLEEELRDAAMHCSRFHPRQGTLADERRELLSAITGDLWENPAQSEASLALLRHLAR
jgi:hypothetical protein